MSARSKARKRALDILFAADSRNGGDYAAAIENVLAEEAARAGTEPQRAASWTFAREIVTGVREHLDEIDTVIGAAAPDWPIPRMPQVDRAALRIGVWELRFTGDTPRPVVIAEAVRLVADHSTDRSATFVNGVLARVAAE